MPLHPAECGRKLLDALLEGKDEEALKLLKDDVDFKVECRGDNPIHLAARNGKLEIIKAMKNARASLKQKNLHGNTAMHYAAKGGYIEVIEYLKSNGADLNATNADGETPLDKAVTSQTMNIIETLVDLGMNPNHQNEKNGETPLFSALRAGAQEAMEGLLIKGAKPGIRNLDGQKAEDVGSNTSIKESLKMYSTMLIAMSSGLIRAKGMKITRKDVTKPMVVDRVGVVLAKFDIPKGFPTGFYCRREKTENTTIKLRKIEEESVFSDVFHIRLFEVNRDCDVQINLPLYRAPTEKEQLVLRFYNCPLEDEPIDEYITENKMSYCPFEETLVPETNYVCVVYIRQRKEENTVSDEATKITSEIEKDFSLDIPPETFEEETILSLQVFETNDESEDSGYDDESLDSVSVVDQPDQPAAQRDHQTDTIERPEQSLAKTDSSNDATEQPTQPNTPPDTLKEETEAPETDAESEKTSEDTGSDALVPVKRKPPERNLLTDVYQINVSGQQPSKGITVQIPLCKGMTPDDEIAIVRADETMLENEDNEKVMEILDGKPKIVGCNLIFEVSHFCVFVATWKKKVDTKEGLNDVQRQIGSARAKRKSASFFVMVKRDPEDETGRRNILVVECGVLSKTKDRRKFWANEQFVEQNPVETGEMMMSPGDTFYVDVTGNATMEDAEDAKERRINFAICRSSHQFFRVNLNQGIYTEDEAFGHIVISKKSDNRLDEVARLRVKMKPPPRPPPPPTPRRTPSRQNSTASNSELGNLLYKNRDDMYRRPGSNVVDTLKNLF